MPFRLQAEEASFSEAHHQDARAKEARQFGMLQANYGMTDKVQLSLLLIPLAHVRDQEQEYWQSSCGPLNLYQNCFHHSALIAAHW